MSLRHLFEELKRRHVMRVTGVYLVAAWAIVQVAATVFPLLGFHDTAAKAVVIAVIVGLPVVVLLAWFFDVTPQGIQRTPDAAVEPAQAAADVAAQIERHRRRFAARSVGFVGVGILVALVGLAAFDRYAMAPSDTSGIESIAVLPFADLSAAHDQEYFTDGVAEELLNRPARVEGLRVTPRTSSFAFKNRNLEVDQIGRQLNVEAVLEGSLRRDGDDVRVTARLVNTETGKSIWSETCERKVSSLFAIQDEISTAIVDALKLQFAPAATLSGVRAPGTRNAHAQDLYFKALKAWNERTEAQLQVALRYFHEATEADTAYALAYAGLAKTYAVLPTVGRFPVADALRRGSEAAARAIALDPGLGEAHAALGQLAQNLEWDLGSALRSYRRAVKFNPNDAVAHQWYSEALMLTGDLESAAAEIELALEIDPFSAAAKAVRAYQILLRGDASGALRAFQNLLREFPEFRIGQLNYAFSALAARDYGSAAEGLIAALPQLAPDVGMLISAASGRGGYADAVRAIDAMASTDSSSINALLYAAASANDRALAVLESAFDASQDANFPYFLVHPLFRPLRDRPAFQQMVRAVGVSLPA